MPNLAQMKALLSLNIGRDVGKAANVLSNAEIEAAIRARFPGAKITAHDVIPAQPGTKFGPFESTSRVTLQGAPGSLNDSLFGLSQDLKQQAIPGINHSTNEAVLAGPQAADWGSEFSKSHFVHPGDQTAFGNRQEDFKNQFTGGFYHGSPANNIEAFDPTKSAKDPMYITPKATFVTRDPEFAESFLSMNNSGKMKTGSTMYPVSVNLGQHWHPDTQEGQKVISDFVEKYPKRAGLEKGLNRGDWTAIENSDFLTHLKDTGHDTFHVVEGGIPNVGVLKPENIRGKFAAFNPEDAASPEIMKAEGGAVQGYQVGGAIKKALKFAEDVPFLHYSNKPSLTSLEPGMYGTGIKGAEAARLKDAPELRPRSYFYVDKGGDTMRPEQGLGNQKYQGTASGVYNLAEDPESFRQVAKTKALDPYLMSMGREMVDPAVHANELERLIKGSGYSGYHTGDVGLLFNPTPVTKID